MLRKLRIPRKRRIPSLGCASLKPHAHSECVLVVLHGETSVQHIPKPDVEPETPGGELEAGAEAGGASLAGPYPERARTCKALTVAAKDLTVTQLGVRCHVRGERETCR